jgi:hypothetical protein
VAIDASKVVPDAATPHTESAQASDQDDRASSSAMLEIEVLGGVTDADLAAIVAWIREVKAEHRSSRISIEPVMPLASAVSFAVRTRADARKGWRPLRDSNSVVQAPAALERKRAPLHRTARAAHRPAARRGYCLPQSLSQPCGEPIFHVVPARARFGEEGWRSVTRNCRRSTRLRSVRQRA